jgi:carboxyl-terminal processing protease
VSTSTPLANRPRQTARAVWASLVFSALALAACGGLQQGTGGSAPQGLFARALDQIGAFYIEPVPTRRVALAGIARLSRLDDKISVSDSGDGRSGEAFGLAYDAHSVGFYSLPADGNNRDWGDMVGNLVAAARQASPRLAAMPEEAVEKAVFDGMTSSLDRYSRYATPKSATAQRAARDGYSGIGVTLEKYGETFRIAALCPRGPAEQAGVRPGDALLAVDGVPTAGRTHDDVFDQLRGPVGSAVAVSVQRGGTAAARDVHLRRAFVTQPTVTMTRNGNIAIFRIANFNQSTTQHLAEALGETRRQAGGQLAGIVLDFRGDPGGLLDQAVSLADLFVRDGPIASTTGRHPKSHQRFAASGRAVAADIPIAVLINGGSASASEIVAAALQERGRAVVIGSSSYGKGSVQTVLHLPNDGELILTWASLVTPSGYLLQSHGVVPTICTSGLGDDEGSVQAALQRASGGAARPRGGLDEAGWAQLRQSCPGHETKPAIDLKLAERVLSDPRLYSQVLRGLQTASIASGATAAP